MKNIYRTISSLLLILKHEVEFRNLEFPSFDIEHLFLLAKYFQLGFIVQKDATKIIRLILDGESTERGIWFIALKYNLTKDNYKEIMKQGKQGSQALDQHEMQITQYRYAIEKDMSCIEKL